jgi:hypothetical protein
MNTYKYEWQTNGLLVQFGGFVGRSPSLPLLMRAIKKYSWLKTEGDWDNDKKPLIDSRNGKKADSYIERLKINTQ